MYRDYSPFLGGRERLLFTLSVGILGVGTIGSKSMKTFFSSQRLDFAQSLLLLLLLFTVAEMCKAFGMTVWGMTRSEPVTKCPHVDHHRYVPRYIDIIAMAKKLFFSEINGKMCANRG